MLDVSIAAICFDLESRARSLRLLSKNSSLNTAAVTGFTQEANLDSLLSLTRKADGSTPHRYTCSRR